MNSPSVCYFYIREYIYETETKPGDYRYVGVVKLGLLTEDQADMVFQEALRRFIDVIDNNKPKIKQTNIGNEHTNTENKKRFRMVLHLDSKRTPCLMKHTEYVLKSENEVDDQTILQWNMMSESFFRGRYPAALRQLDQSGHITPTNETILAVAVRAAEWIRLPDSDKSGINLREKPVYDIPTSECNNDDSQKILPTPCKGFTPAQAKSNVRQKDTDATLCHFAKILRSYRQKRNCDKNQSCPDEEQKSTFAQGKPIADPNENLEKTEASPEIQEHRDSSLPPERKEADQNNSCTVNHGSGEGDDEKLLDEEPRRGRPPFDRSLWIIKQCFEEKLTPAKIRNKWNSLKPEEREAIDPEHSEPYGKSSEEKKKALGQIKSVIRGEKKRREKEQKKAKKRRKRGG